MKLKFVIDKEYDIKVALGLKRSGYWAFKDREIRRDSIEEQYSNSSKALDLTQKLYQESWDEINDKFSDYVERTTGYGWSYPEYACVVSVVTPGASNWGHGNRIVRNWRENPYWMRRITAHELILSHYFEIYRKHYNPEGLTDGQVWALAEIAANALTSLTSEVKEFWPWFTDYYTFTSYPHIVELQNVLKDAFLRRKSFDDYIKQGTKHVKDYPKMGPAGT